MFQKCVFDVLAGNDLFVSRCWGDAYIRYIRGNVLPSLGCCANFTRNVSIGFVLSGLC